MLNRVVKNGRVRKFWLTEITGPLPEVIPNILVGRTYRNFRNLCIGIMENIRGFQESMHCSMASEVMGSRVGVVVRALAFHQCVPGSIPGPGVICGLSLLVLYSAPRGFSPGTPVFPSPQKPTFELI